MEEAKASLSQSAYRRWQLYWIIEPWGSFRDNLHAAMIAAQVRALRMKKGQRIALEPFMVVDPRSRERQNRAGFLALLHLISQPASEVKQGRKGKPRTRGRVR